MMIFLRKCEIYCLQRSKKYSVQNWLLEALSTLTYSSPSVFACQLLFLMIIAVKGFILKIIILNPRKTEEKYMLWAHSVRSHSKLWSSYNALDALSSKEVLVFSSSPMKSHSFEVEKTRSQEISQINISPVFSGLLGVGVYGLSAFMGCQKPILETSSDHIKAKRVVYFITIHFFV